MLIHEYQGKTLLAEQSIFVPQGMIATTPEEALKAAHRIGGTEWMVKAQIHAGGRGLGGGILTASHPEEVKQHAAQLLGSHLVTPQTPPQGLPIHTVYIEERLPLQKDFYLCLMLDPSSASIVLLAAKAGGVNIETAAARGEEFLSIPCPVSTSIQPLHARLLGRLYDTPHLTDQLLTLLRALYDVCLKHDVLQLELNPLALTKNDEWVVLDCKTNLDDNAFFRHEEWRDLKDDSQSAAIDSEAARHQLRYIGLDGDIGCMVNGAGLAMATMDALVQASLAPANFLDIGGDADVARVESALRLMIETAQVKKILINIFGGIVHCDTIAKGLVEAARNLSISVPLVVRLAGAKVNEAHRILQESSLNIITANNLKEAVQLIAQDS